MKLIILGFGFLSTLMMALGKVMIPSGKVTWKADPELKSALSSKPCDIPIIDGSNPIEIALSSYPRTPVIFRNFTSHWPANILWDKEDLSKAFGERIIRAGTESSIVYSAGNAEMNIRLDQFLRGLDNSSMFAFDTTILTAIPELNQHFQVPPIFADWDTPEKEENKELWHMISIGPSRSGTFHRIPSFISNLTSFGLFVVGLPFHNHGKTWLAVIKGSKYWFLYPPGYGPPREADLVFNALNSSFDWYSKVHSLALAFAEDIAPLEPNIESGRSSSKGYRPLECLQQAGDVMFLPSMWSHMTLNVGQTIAIGGQQYLTEQERFDTALKAFRNNASSYETFKGAIRAQIALSL